MGFKKWIVADFDKQLAKELAEECNVDPIVALIASSRGYDDPMDLEQFLSDEPVFSDPRQTADIMLAAEIVNAAIEDGVKIAIYGDYDCDGVTATALLYSYLTSRNANCIYYIPDRFEEGYGMNEEAIKSLHSRGVKLIITVDNGISAIKEIDLAKSLGMDVVVTDHHLPGAVLPSADAVVDPHRSDCPSEFKEICGAQVAFRLICVMENKEPEELLPYFADILSLAVVGDIMPLTGENRSIVKCGVEKLKTAPLTGLSALMSVAGLEQRNMDATKIAFGLTPRINASGRMGDAKRAVMLLTDQNMLSALGIANEIDADNSHRQQIEKQIFAEALHKIEAKGYENNRVIVCSGKDWHAGVIGIVAAKIAERFGKPAIMITVNSEGSAHGSGRGVEGFSLFNAIAYCKDCLTKYGGHEQAAGISLEEESINLFRKKINEYANNGEYIAPSLHIDCRLNPSALTVDLASAIKELEPFGSQNPSPVFGVWGVTLTRITPIGGGKHLRMLFSKGSNTFSGLLFGVSAERLCFDEGDILDLAVSVQENEYKGEIGVSVIVKAIRISGTDDDKLFSELSLWEDFLSNAQKDYSSIAPSRQEIGTVYRYICKQNVLTDKAKYHFINLLGIGKTLAAIKVLEELCLLKTDNDMLIGIKTNEKTDLEKSETFLKLTKGGI